MHGAKGVPTYSASQQKTYILDEFKNDDILVDVQRVNNRSD